MAPPVLAVFGLAVVAGVGLTLGKRLVTRVIEPNWKDRVEPWIKDQAEGFNRWSKASRRSGAFDDGANPSEYHTTAGTEGAAPTTASPNDGTDPAPAPPPRP